MEDVGLDLKGLENEDIWCVDPVHPIQPVYRRIAGGIMMMVQSLEGEDHGTGTKRMRVDSLDNNFDTNNRRPREHM
jgi:hypothetical protein